MSSAGVLASLQLNSTESDTGYLSRYGRCHPVREHDIYADSEKSKILLLLSEN